MKYFYHISKISIIKIFYRNINLYKKIKYSNFLDEMKTEDIIFGSFPKREERILFK